ncbi:hypothetical protein MKZ38_002969 [Zalerion maritima]|uniref:DUF1682-domain-containing protein n=1 Tax=Zalerion maritima TaxID=339359 RepID=A0AAD5RN81_9PEZI|nr:hypothetical protein MKZ38_002969 [Zalerion maritima]
MNFFKGDKKPEAEAPVVDADADFGDFAAGAADAAEPAPVPIQPLDGAGADATLDPNMATITTAPYTKWYRLDERYSPSDFWAEGLLIGAFAFLMVLYTWGFKKNRSRSRNWFKAHSPSLAKEFASVGFSPEVVVAAATADETSQEVSPEQGLRKRSPYEYASYATGRANVGFVDLKLELIKRFNPVNALVEFLLATFFESFPMPEDSMEAVMYPFDGHEGQMVPEVPGTSEVRKLSKSTYDGFVFALVNKDRMKKLREDRYDISITFTKDHPKLPIWATAMSENAEITDALLTSELVQAIEKAGDLFDYLIVTDQPIIKPTTVEECTSTKRIYLKYHLPSTDDYSALLPLFDIFLRLPDHLVKVGHFRSQVTSKLRIIREAHLGELKKVAEAEKAEERALEKDKARKEKRDRELAALDAKGQKKYLEKEKEKEYKKSMKKSSMKG